MPVVLPLRVWAFTQMGAIFLILHACPILRACQGLDVPLGGMRMTAMRKLGLAAQAQVVGSPAVVAVGASGAFRLGRVAMRAQRRRMTPQMTTR